MRHGSERATDYVATYVRTNAQSADAGPYTVVVSNNHGAILSAAALLTVMPPRPGVVALWTFNSQPGDTNPATGTTEPSFGSGTAALVGGTTAGFSAGDALDSESPNDNSAWDTSQYAGTTQQNKTHGVQFNASTTGLKNIRVTWRESVTASASKWVRLQYATNGTFFDAPTATAMTAAGVFESKSNNLAAITGLNNNANLALQIVAEFESTAAGTGSPQYVTTSGGSYSMSGEILFDLVTVYGDSTNVAPPHAGGARFDSQPGVSVQPERAGGCLLHHSRHYQPAPRQLDPAEHQRGAVYFRR